MSSPSDLEPCPGCGALVPDIGEASHRYIGASSGCWAIFGALHALSLEDPARQQVHQYVVDTYAVQHPGVPLPQSIQSVAVHLISLYAALALGQPVERAPALLQRAVRQRGVYHWLEPPSFDGVLTILHVSEAPPEHYVDCVLEWARSVWQAWTPHRETVASWYAAYAAP